MLICTDVYYASFPTDSRLYKAVVYVVFVLEAVNIILGTYDLGRMFIHPHYHPFLSYWAAPLCGATSMINFLRFDAEAENLKRCY